ncbi:MAG: CBS domain-containing protein [Candidatus Thorarchaeota archaeon]
MKISEIMIKDVKTIKKGGSMKEAAQIMLDNNVGSIIVVNDITRKAIGVITRTDILKLFLSEDFKSHEVPVDKFLKSKLIKVNPDDQSDVATELFVKNKLHHLIVEDSEGKLVGVLSTLDIIDLLYHQNQSFPYFIPKEKKIKAI